MLFTTLIRDNRDLFTLDTTRTLAAVCGDAAMRHAITVEDGKVQFRYNQSQSQPFVLHYTFDGDMTEILNALKFDWRLHRRKRSFYSAKLYLHHF